jgi:hypothetical protein
MPMTFDGNGTITGLAAGGLPNSSVITADIADAAITAAKLDGAQSGSAPIYGARAWVNFNGTGTVAIRASGNVSSITDRGTGQYTINFATALSDTNYAMFASGSVSSGFDISEVAVATSGTLTPEAPTTTSFKIFSYRDGVAEIDPPYVCIAVFR